MPNDSPDWAALTDVGSVPIGNLTIPPAGGMFADGFFQLDAATVGVLVLLQGQQAAGTTLGIYGGNSTEPYVSGLDVSGARVPIVIAPVNGKAEISVEVRMNFASPQPGNAVVATVFALRGAGFSMVTAPPAQPLPVDASRGGAVGTTQGTVPWLEVEQAPSSILGGSSNAGGATLVTIPAGKTWRGSVQISNETPNSSVQVQTVGAGVTPAAGTALCASVLAAGASATSNADIAEVYVSAPAGNAVTLATVVAGAPVFIAVCNGRLL